jgi:hypothetical protein
VIDRWKVLPTDQRFKDLTEEQIIGLQEQFFLDHPELEKELFVDPNYEQAEKEMLADGRAERAKADLDLPPIDV